MRWLWIPAILGLIPAAIAHRRGRGSVAWWIYGFLLFVMFVIGYSRKEGVQVGWLLIPLIIGLIPAAIARSKGRSFVTWWIYGVLLSIVALVHSLVIKPDRWETERRLIVQGMRKCPFCAEMIKVEAVVCHHCGRDLQNK